MVQPKSTFLYIIIGVGLPCFLSQILVAEVHTAKFRDDNTPYQKNSIIWSIISSSIYSQNAVLKTMYQLVFFLWALRYSKYKREILFKHLLYSCVDISSQDRHNFLSSYPQSVKLSGVHHSVGIDLGGITFKNVSDTRWSFLSLSTHSLTTP